MINYVVATNVERFVRFAFGHSSLRSTALHTWCFSWRSINPAMCSTNQMVLGVDLARLSLRRSR
jgi:hypothetical protein